MDPTNNGANNFTMEELEQLFQSESEQATPPADNSVAENVVNDTEQNSNASESDNVDTTKAFAKRLRESTEKARREEREAIAKSLGYESYDDMQKKRENQILRDKGFDPDEVSPLVDEIVKQRLENDPRIKELETLRAKQVQEFGRQELAEITKLTGGEITSLTQLSPEVIELWKKKGSLKSAYIELEGEKLIGKIRGEQSKGSTDHLRSPSGTSTTPSKQRLLTDEEKRVWKFFNPGMSDEELNKKLVDI